MGLVPLGKVPIPDVILTSLFYPDTVDVLHDEYDIFSVIRNIHKEYKRKRTIFISRKNNKIKISFGKALIIDRIYKDINDFIELAKIINSLDVEIRIYRSYRENSYIIDISKDSISLREKKKDVNFEVRLGGADLISISYSYYTKEGYMLDTLYISPKGEIIHYSGEEEFKDKMYEVAINGICLEKIPRELDFLRKVLRECSLTITFFTYTVLMVRDLLNVIISNPKKYSKIISKIVTIKW